MNGRWNNYGNATFIEAWRRVHSAIRADPALANVALVWDASCDHDSKNDLYRPYQVSPPPEDGIVSYMEHRHLLHTRPPLSLVHTGLHGAG